MKIRRKSQLFIITSLISIPISAVVSTSFLRHDSVVSVFEVSIFFFVSITSFTVLYLLLKVVDYHTSGFKKSNIMESNYSILDILSLGQIIKVFFWVSMVTQLIMILSVLYFPSFILTFLEK